MMSADGAKKRQIIFSSNLHDPERKSFSLYTVSIDGTGLERVTYDARFDSFSMFSRDGKKACLRIDAPWAGTAGIQHLHCRLAAIVA